MTEEWRLRRDPDGTDAVDDELVSVEVTDAINPFANAATVVLDDPDGTKREAYPRPTLIELDVRRPDLGESFSRRFAGFVQDRSHDRNQTELLILSHDYWLRARTVFADHTDAAISTILEDLITQFTPLVWDPNRISIENDDTISREWAGENLETVIGQLRDISGGDELFGATFDREFFFEPLDDSAAPRDFTAGEYTATRWTEDGKQDINRAIVHYGEGSNEGIVVENDRSAQRAWRDTIGASRPVEDEFRERRPEITSESQARDRAQQLLEQQSVIESGTIDTWEAFDVAPGELTRVVDPEQDVDQEVRVAELAYEWPGGDPPTQVTVAGQAADTTDELIDLSDDVERIDLRNANPDAPFLEVAREKSGVTLEVTASIVASTPGGDRHQPGFGRGSLGFQRDMPGFDFEHSVAGLSDGRATGDLLTELRDLWRGQTGSITTETIAVGTDGATPSQTDAGLGTELERVDVSTQAPGAAVAHFEGVVRLGSDATLREVGILDADTGGTLWARAAGDELSVPAGDRVSVVLTVSLDDDGERRGVVTEGGQEVVRDCLVGVDVSAETPSEMAFGDDDTPPQESDTALGNELLAITIDSFRTAGTGRVDVAGRLDASQLQGEDVAEIGQQNSADELLTRVAFAPLAKEDFEFEAVEQIQFSNA